MSRREVAMVAYATNLVKLWVADLCTKRLSVLKDLYNKILNSRITVCPICDTPHPIDQHQIVRAIQHLDQITNEVFAIVQEARTENLAIERNRESS